MTETLVEADRNRSITIVMPVFNGMPWIPEAVASVSSQRDVDVELIVLDAGSNDGTREWLTAFAPDGTRLVFEPDRGQSDAIAKGLAMASGRVLGWLNADDVLEPEALATACDTFERNPEASMVSGACLIIDERGTVTGRIDTPPDGSLHGLLRHPFNLAQPATLFSAEAYRQTPGIDLALHYAMDVDLWLKLARIGPAVLLPDQVLARFRVHQEAKSSRAATAMVREDLRVRLRHGMPILSRAFLSLVRWSYLRPIKRPLRLLRPGSSK